MASYSFKTHYEFEKIRRRYVWRLTHYHYTALDYVQLDSATANRMWLDLLSKLQPSFDIVYPDYAIEYDSAYKTEKRFDARRYRYYSFVKKMVSNMQDDDRLYWITFTIKNEYVSCKFSTLKKYFIRHISGYSTNWLACEDYGEEYGRLHFHCIAVVPSEHYKKFTFDKNHVRLPLNLSSIYGFVDIKPLPFASLRKRFNYCIGCVSYARKAKKGFEGYKPFHNRNFVYRLFSDDCLQCYVYNLLYNYVKFAHKIKLSLQL